MLTDPHDLRILEEVLEKEIHRLRSRATSENYGRWKSLTKVLDSVREAM